jgi:hypothetical protein
MGKTFRKFRDFGNEDDGIGHQKHAKRKGHASKYKRHSEQDFNDLDEQDLHELVKSQPDELLDKDLDDLK